MPRLRRSFSDLDWYAYNPVGFTQHREAFERFTPHREANLPLPASEATLANMPCPWLPHRGPSRLVDSLLLSLYGSAPADSPSYQVSTATDFRPLERYEADVFLNHGTLQKARIVKRKARSILTSGLLGRLPAEARQMVLAQLLEEEDTTLDFNVRYPRNVLLYELVTDTEAPLDWSDPDVAASMRALLRTRLAIMAREYIAAHEQYMQTQVLSARPSLLLGFDWRQCEEMREWWAWTLGPGRRNTIAYMWQCLRRYFAEWLEFRLHEMWMLEQVVRRMGEVMGLDEDDGSDDGESDEADEEAEDEANEHIDDGSGGSSGGASGSGAGSGDGLDESLYEADDESMYDSDDGSDTSSDDESGYGSDEVVTYPTANLPLQDHFPDDDLSEELSSLVGDDFEGDDSPLYYMGPQEDDPMEDVLMFSAAQGSAPPASSRQDNPDEDEMDTSPDVPSSMPGPSGSRKRKAPEEDDDENAPDEEAGSSEKKKQKVDADEAHERPESPDEDWQGTILDRGQYFGRDMNLDEEFDSVEDWEDEEERDMSS